MSLSKEDMDRIYPATLDIATGIGKTLAELSEQLEAKYGLTTQHVQIATARAFISCASGAWASAFDLSADDASDIAGELDEVLIKAIE